MNQGTLRITRRISWFERLVHWRVILDDRQIGTLRRGDSQSFNVPAGRHSLSIRNRFVSESQKWEFELTEGETKSFECGIHPFFPLQFCAWFFLIFLISKSGSFLGLAILSLLAAAFFLKRGTYIELKGPGRLLPIKWVSPWRGTVGCLMTLGISLGIGLAALVIMGLALSSSLGWRIQSSLLSSKNMEFQGVNILKPSHAWMVIKDKDVRDGAISYKIEWSPKGSLTMEWIPLAIPANPASPEEAKRLAESIFDWTRKTALQRARGMKIFGHSVEDTYKAWYDSYQFVGLKPIQISHRAAWAAIYRQVQRGGKIMIWRHRFLPWHGGVLGIFDSCEERAEESQDRAELPILEAITLP